MSRSDLINTIRCESTRIDQCGKVFQEKVCLLKEHKLDIFVNDKVISSIICTKDHLNELVTGNILTLGYANSVGDIEDIVFSDDEKKACVTLFAKTGIREKEDVRLDPIDKDSIRKQTDSDLLPLQKDHTKLAFKMAEQFSEDMPLHDMTGCTHTCILYRAGESVFFCEDIGRHNAFDKVVGYMMNNHIPPHECAVFTSGRIPSDMVIKAVRVHIPVIVSKSAVTADSVELADKYGLVIISRAYRDSLQIITKNEMCPGNVGGSNEE